MNEVTVEGLNKQLRKDHNITVDIAKYSKAQLEGYAKKLDSKLKEFDVKHSYNESLTNESYQRNSLIKKLIETAINQYIDNPLESIDEEDLGEDIVEVDVTDEDVARDFAESDIDQIADVGKVYSKINNLKMYLVDKGMEPEDAQDKACEKYDCDPSMYDKYVEMKRDEREGTKKESKELDEGAVKDMMQDVEEGMDKKEFEKKYPGQDYDGIKKDIEDRMDETTSSGSVATSEGAGKPLYQNASVYESNEIVKRAKQLNEDMSISVNAGTNAEPSININASGEEAAKLAQLLKLAGMGMAQPGYGEVQVDVAEDQEFANGADDTNTMDTEYMTQDIAGGLNGPKKMAYPKVAGGDNPMSVLGESELNEVSEDRLMKLYQEYKAK